MSDEIIVGLMMPKMPERSFAELVLLRTVDRFRIILVSRGLRRDSISIIPSGNF